MENDLEALHGANLTRRRLVASAGGLSAMALGGLTIPTASAAAPLAENVRELLIERRARLDGKPAFWVTRGTQLAIIDGKAIPLAGRLVISVWRFKDVGNGEYDIPYIECFVTTEPSTFRFSTERPNPITGGIIKTPIPEADLHVMRMHTNGTFSQEKHRPDGSSSIYQGEYFAQQGFDGQTWVTEKYVVNRKSASGHTDTMTEVKTTLPKGKSVNGYLAAEMTQTAFMSAIPPETTGGKQGALVGYYYSRKCPTVEAVRKEIDPENVKVAEHFFKNWESMMP